MIRVHRPATEPQALTQARSNALQELRPNGPATRKQLPPTPKVAREGLWHAQFCKCAYCEHREQLERNDVEHFRPAMRAKRHPGSAATHGYWWLAYTWENLLFSCRNCNQSPAKLDKFPLAVGSKALIAEEQPPGEEKPLLIDPAKQSAVEHIEFVRRAKGKPTGWVPVPRNGSPLGLNTIQVCKLDRPGLLTLYRNHVERTLSPALELLQEAIATGDAPTAQRQWSEFVGRYVTKSSVFAGLSHDVLASAVDARTRAKYQLALPDL